MDARNQENRVPLELLLIPESNSSLSRPSDRSLSNGDGDTDSRPSSAPRLLRRKTPLLAQIFRQLTHPERFIRLGSIATDTPRARLLIIKKLQNQKTLQNVSFHPDRYLITRRSWVQILPRYQFLVRSQDAGDTLAALLSSTHSTRRMICLTNDCVSGSLENQRR